MIGAETAFQYHEIAAAETRVEILGSFAYAPKGSDRWLQLAEAYAACEFSNQDDLIHEWEDLGEKGPVSCRGVFRIGNRTEQEE